MVCPRLRAKVGLPSVVHRTTLGPMPPDALIPDHAEDLLLRIADGERSRLLARRKLLEGRKEFAYVGRRRRHQEDTIEEPIVIGVRRDLPTLIGIAPQVEQQRHTQDGPGFRPGPHGLREAMLQEDDLPVVVAQSGHITGVREIEDLVARCLFLFAQKVGQRVVAIEVDPVVTPDRLDAVSLQLFLDVIHTGHGQEGRQPVHVVHDLVRDSPGFDLAGPAHHARYAERAFPIGVLFAPERRPRSIRPGVHVRSVVSGVEHQRLVGDAEFVEQVEELAYMHVMLDHACGVLVDVFASGLVGHGTALFADVDPEVHARAVPPDEPGRPLFPWPG